MQSLPVFQCNQCGECCRHINIIPQLSAFVGKDGVCIHLKGNLCDIYENRPEICNYTKAYHKYFYYLSPQKYHQIIVENCVKLQEQSQQKEEK